MKANLARFTVALSLLATIALTLGAGVKWEMFEFSELFELPGLLSRLF